MGLLSGNIFERTLKRLALTLLKGLASPVGPAPTARDLENVRRILVVRPDERIGNLILVTSLLVALKGRFSRAKQSCLISRRYWGLRKHIPSTDTFIAFDKRAAVRNPFRLFALIRRIRRQKFDLVFDAAGDHSLSLTHLALTALSGGRFRIGHDRGEAGRFYEVAVPQSAEDVHASERHLDLLRAVTPIRSTARPLLRPAADTGFAQRFREENHIPPESSLIVLHPGARGDKRWPAEHFAEVAKTLATAHRLPVALIWGPADVRAATDVQTRVGDKIHVAGILDFDDLISLLRSASVFLSSDCGPMHLAAASGTPVVAIFQASSLEKYRTLGATDLALNGRVTPVTPAQVVAAVLAVLSRRAISSAGDTPPAVEPVETGDGQ